LVQARQVFVVVSQTGFVPPHCALASQLRQLPAATSHSAVGPLQAPLFVAEQTPQAPLAWQAGVAPPQSLSAPQARQVCVAMLQTGVAPPHWALLAQPTHVPVAASHVDVAPPQRPAFVAEHWPHEPPGWHTGFAGPHCASAVQPRQVCVAASHTGLPPEQSALEAQPTQVPLAASHAGVAPPQAPARAAEHWPQAPLA
jgi:hypothetical protein